MSPFRSKIIIGGGIFVGLVLVGFVIFFLFFRKYWRLDRAAGHLVSDIEMVKNKAQSCDTSASNCESGEDSLLGWYVTLNKGDGNWAISCDCSQDNSESSSIPKTINFPNEIRIANDGIAYNEVSIISNGVNIFFPAMATAPYFHANSTTPPFYSSQGYLKDTLGAGVELTIELEEDNYAKKFKVVIKSSGEINV